MASTGVGVVGGNTVGGFGCAARGKFCRWWRWLLVRGKFMRPGQHGFGRAGPATIFCRFRWRSSAQLYVGLNLGSDMEIPDSVHAEIKELCAEGDVLLEMKEFSQAYENYIAALELVPEPKEEFHATTWIMAALGDLYFQSKDFSQTVKVLSDSMHCAGALGNPFIHLRLGQAQLELNNPERAADELCRAYMGAGKKIFDKEDPRYFSFLKTRISPPSNGVW